MTNTDFLTSLTNKEVEVYCGEWVRGTIAKCRDGIVTLQAKQETHKIPAESILATNHLI